MWNLQVQGTYSQYIYLIYLFSSGLLEVDKVSSSWQYITENANFFVFAFNLCYVGLG